jgi:2-C-methyl-D-erythritol 4-phosphate cytidylyltransferase
VEGDNLVIVHDAVRPFVKLAHVKNCCEAAVKVGAAVLGVPAKDTIKRLDNDDLIVDTPSRKYLWQAQTPQVFKKEVLQEAYQKALEDNFIGTDDASLVERLGYPVKMVEGDRSNFKITYPLDLKLAKLLLDS